MVPEVLPRPGRIANISCTRPHMIVSLVAIVVDVLNDVIAQGLTESMWISGCCSCSLLMGERVIALKLYMAKMA